MMMAFLISDSSRWICTLDERLLVLGVLVLGVLRQVAVLLGIVDSLRDLGASDVDQLLELGSQLGQTLFRDVLSPVVHRGAAPFSVVRRGPVEAWRARTGEAGIESTASRPVISLFVRDEKTNSRSDTRAS